MGQGWRAGWREILKSRHLCFCWTSSAAAVDSMANYRDIRDLLLIFYDQNMIDDVEFLLLNHLNSTRNRSRRRHEPFDLEELTDDECYAEFQFSKTDIFTLKDVLNIPEEVTCSRRLAVSGTEALCVLLQRFSHPVKFDNMEARFGRPANQLRKIASAITNMVYNKHRHRLSSLQQEWLSPVNLQRYAEAIHAAGSPLDNCWGFVYGSLIQVAATPKARIYNGSKRISDMKFQSVVAPNGLIAHLYGPLEGKRHDCTMLRESELLPQLELYSRSLTGNPLCIYGDMKYPMRQQLQMPFHGEDLHPAQQAYNTSMASLTKGVQWVFDDINGYLNFMDFKRNAPTEFGAVKKAFIVCAILRNVHTCLYKSTTTDFFGVSPPSIQDYFS